jgi:GalNAc-alpha-(1->4)-GalNAc-alpha-(1->3)-diNAcBac-PP-undecaprenol alpha-1,4-N-acetyl-D-galactosaminyltransferase
MKRVCFIIPSLHPGGMERVMSELAQNFAKRKDIDLHILLYGIKRDIFYEIPDNITIHKPLWEFNNKYRFVYTLRTLVYVRSTILDINPDYILSFGEYWNSFVLLSLLGLKKKIYISDRCKPDKNLGRLQELLRKWLYPKATGVIAQTSKAKEIYAEKKLNSNIIVIGNPVREIEFKEEQKKENIILSVGRLIRTKHHDQLIRIFKQTAPSNWKLVIVGGNANKQNGMAELKSLIVEFGLEGRVELTGTVEDVESYYGKSKIFAFTSSSEGFPNVIGEAMASGLPVISYDCVAGPSELVVDNVNGYLVPLFDMAEYRVKLAKMLSEEGLRAKMGEASKGLIKKFSANEISEKYYQMMVGEHEDITN